MSKEAALKMMKAEFLAGKSMATSLQLDEPRTLRTFMTEPQAASQDRAFGTDVQIDENPSLASFVSTVRFKDCPSLNPSRMQLPELQGLL